MLRLFYLFVKSWFWIEGGGWASVKWTKHEKVNNADLMSVVTCIIWWIVFLDQVRAIVLLTKSIVGYKKVEKRCMRYGGSVNIFPKGDFLPPARK